MEPPSSGLSQPPQSSDPPTDFDLPDSYPAEDHHHPRPLKIQRSSRPRRVVRVLPFELQEQSRILFEESLHTQALRLLETLLTAGYSNENPEEWRPAFVAPPRQLALIATLAVHPTLNTKTRNQQKLTASVQAARYLRLVQSLAGPVDGSLSKSYKFPERTNATRRGIFIRQRSTSPDAATDISSPLATSDSLWTQGRDFWAVAGWAFNCSVRIRRRWSVWSTWLDHMISVLHEDWLLHCTNPENSLIATYLRGYDNRRVMRAVFADGSKTSLQEFGEIWKDEAAEPKAKRRAHEKVQVNFEVDEFGDYMKDSSDEDEVEKLNKIYENGTADPDALMEEGTPMGGAESVELRLRLLALLSEVAAQLPRVFADTGIFAEAFVTCTRPLPFAVFRTVLSLFAFDYFSYSQASLLVQSLACSFMESSAPHAPADELSQEVLATCYLPWTANTVSASDNAKLSACIEALVRLYVSTHRGESWNDAVTEALHRGIDKRQQKAQRLGKTKAEASGRTEPSDLERLTSSGERLQLLTEGAGLQPG